MRRPKQPRALDSEDITTMLISQNAMLQKLSCMGGIELKQMAEVIEDAGLRYLSISKKIRGMASFGEEPENNGFPAIYGVWNAMRHRPISHPD